jgi:hypothetical protein
MNRGGLLGAASSAGASVSAAGAPGSALAGSATSASFAAASATGAGKQQQQHASNFDKSLDSDEDEYGDVDDDLNI